MPRSIAVCLPFLRSRFLALLLGGLVLACGLAGPGEGAPVFEEGFDGAAPVWRIEQDSSVRPLQQQCVRVDRDGTLAGVEWLRYACRPGYAARYWMPIPRAPVLDELRVSITLRSELPGAVLAARLVLPRVIDPSTGQPQTTIVRGERGDQPGVWQTLVLKDLSRLAADSARALRARPGAPTVDERGAYLDRVVLLLPGAAKGASVWMDELQVEGVVLPSGQASDDRAGLVIPQLASSPRSGQERVTLTAKGFAIGGRPFFPRVWSHLGGSLSDIRETGFNAVAFDTPPSAEQLEEAKSLKLRVICPPPKGSDRDRLDWSPVMAWLIGEEDGSVDAAQAFAERIRSADPGLDRPIIAAPDGQWSQWSRIADALVIHRQGPNTPAAERLRAQRTADIIRLSRPGVAMLHRVEATPSAEAADQLAVFVSSDPAIANRSIQQINANVWSAVAMRAAGVWVRAGQRLGGADAETMRLKRGLTLLNRQLQLIDPWLAGGTRGPLLVDSQGVARAAMMKRGRVRLLVPPGVTRAAEGARLVVPGGGASSAARLTPAGVSLLPVERVAGGVRVDARALDFNGMVVLTDDRQAMRAISGRAAKHARESVKLMQQMARDELATLTASLPQTQQATTDPVRRDAERRISVSNAAAAAGNSVEAYLAAAEARRRLAEPFASRERDPLLRTPLALAAGHRASDVRLGDLLAGAPRGANLLTGGDFESLDGTRVAGWTNTELRVDGVSTAVELDASNAAHGRKCLRLSVAAEGEGALPLAAGDCPVWIATPSVRLGAGQLVEVTGWVRLAGADEDQPARLIISDSLGGADLSRVVDSAKDWRMFRMLRRAPRETELRVTFGLSGVGSGYVDAVMIRPVQVGGTPPVRLRPADPVASRPADAAQSK